MTRRHPWNWLALAPLAVGVALLVAACGGGGGNNTTTQSGGGSTTATNASGKTFAVFNNHKDAKAFSNALQLKARLSPSVPVRAPVSLRERYPALRASTIPDGDEQLPLV